VNYDSGLYVNQFGDAPAATFNGGESTATDTVVQLTNGSAGGKTWKIISSGASNSAGAGKLLIQENTQPVATFKSDGNVGIGNLEPKLKLHIGSGESTITQDRVDVVIATEKRDVGIAIAQKQDDNSAPVNLLLQASTAGAYIGTKSAHSLVLRTQDDDRLVIDENGNVTIVNDVKIVNAESGAIVIDSRNKLDGSPLRLIAKDPAPSPDQPYFMWMINNSSNKLRFYNSKGSVTYIDENGRLSIPGGIDQPDWQTPQLTAGFANYSGQNPAGYFKDSLGVVHLRGMVTCPTKADPQILEVYLLPEGYRPQFQEACFVMSFANTSDPPPYLSSYKPIRLSISNDGKVVIALPANTAWFSFDNVTFRAK
jgi:hypothetical protein